VAYDRDRARALAKDVAAFVPDVGRLFRDVLKDDRVPRLVKAEAALALAYVVSPIDVIPDFLPGIGQLDDIAVIAWAVRRLLLGAGEPVLRELWRGKPKALETLLQLASSGVFSRRGPLGLLRRKG
jgi:uncharacterized membrane protein YkvA (DUF1232 family)